MTMVKTGLTTWFVWFLLVPIACWWLNAILRVGAVGDDASMGAVMYYLSQSRPHTVFVHWAAIATGGTVLTLSFLGLRALAKTEDEKSTGGDTPRNQILNQAQDEEIPARLMLLAAELPLSMRVFAGALVGALNRQHPDFFIGDSHDRLLFALTVSGTWVACVELHHDVAEEKWRTPLEQQVRVELTAWNQDAEQALEHMSTYVRKKILALPRSERHERLLQYAARWSVVQATRGEPRPDQKAIESAVYEMVLKRIPGYWLSV